MLKKLLKYDLKYNYKNLIIFYILSIFFSIITKIFTLIDNSTICYIIGKICSGITISMFFNIIINNLMRLWTNFTTNIYRDESYLTHTLPVTKKQIYNSKFITTIITMISSMIVIIISMFIAYYTKENITILKDSLEYISNIYDSTIIKLILTIFIVLILEIINIILSGHTGIILGHKMNNNKIGLSVLFGFISYMITQIITIIIIFILALFNNNIMLLFNSSNLPSITTIKNIIYLAVLIYSIYAIIYYFINIKLLEQGVNVD